MIGEKPADMTSKVAIVTGAASGLGRATAIKLAQAGASVTLVDIDADGLQSTAKVIAELDCKTLVKPVDLADPTAPANIIKDSVDTFGRLDALCNIAAVFIPSHTTEMPAQQWEKTLTVNLTAPFLLIQAAIPHLLTSRGAVVNVTSCAAHVGQAYLAAYSASKAALTQLTKSLAMEYMHQPIRFNAVAPGGMMTPLAMGLRDLKSPDSTLLSRLAPLRGLVEIDDVATMVTYLLSDAARGYHGAVINIDNGITAG